MRGGGGLIAKLGRRGTAAGAVSRTRGGPKTGRVQTHAGNTRPPRICRLGGKPANQLISAPVVASDGVGIRLVVRPDRNGVTDAGSHPEHEAVAAAEAHGIHARHVRQLLAIAPGGQFGLEQFLHCPAKLVLHPAREAPRIPLETACGFVESAERRRLVTLHGATRATRMRWRRNGTPAPWPCP